MNTREVVGYATLLHLPTLSALVQKSYLDVEQLLGMAEKARWHQCATSKRRLEFLGGRLAAKVADRVARGRGSSPRFVWSDVQILSDPDGRPYRELRDGSRAQVTISHSGAWVIAVVGSASRTLAVDLEDAKLTRIGREHLHPLEQFQIRTTEDARLRWCVKEACAKFSGVGIQGYELDIVVLGFEGRLWVGLNRSHWLFGSAILAASHLPCFALALMVSEEVSRII